MSTIQKHPREYRLTTAEITYRYPDYPDLLQSYIWQDFDFVPEFPALRKFLAFWERELDGKLHSVTVASAPLLEARRLGAAAGYWRLH